MRIIDCDSHIVVPETFKHVSVAYQNYLPKFSFDADSRLTEVRVQRMGLAEEIHKVDSATLPGLTDLKSRLIDFEKIKVNLQLLTPQTRTMKFGYDLDPNFAAEMAHSYNLVTKEIVDQYPDKFFMAGLVPLQDIELTLKELKWCAEHQIKIVYLLSIGYDQLQKKYIALSMMPGIDKFYKFCQDHDMVIMIHGLMSDPYPINNNLNYSEHARQFLKDSPAEYFDLALCDLLLDDVFDRYPSLKMILAEFPNRGLMKNLANLAQAWANDRQFFKGQQIFTELIKNNFFFTFDVEYRDTLEFLLKIAGSERLLFGTDYPHNDEGGRNKWNDVDDLLRLNISKEALENMAFRNAQNLFALESGTEL